MKPALFIPLILFIALLGFGVFALLRAPDGQGHVNAVGRTAPAFSVIDFSDPSKQITDTFLQGQIHLVNFFASWCAPCVAEHPFLTRISAQTGVPMIGLVYKDKDAAIAYYLKKNGNPFMAVGMDEDGRAAIDWGVTGVPETFLIGSNGKIIAHHVGPMNDAIWQREFAPKLQQLKPARE